MCLSKFGYLRSYCRYYLFIIKKIQIFVMSMTFVSSREVKKNYISFVASALMKYIYFFTSLDEIKVIFMTRKNEYPLYICHVERMKTTLSENEIKF